MNFDRHTHLQRMLLRRAKMILGQCMRLHSLSVKIGQLEELSDTGICDAECAEAATIIEDADRLCADIDKLMEVPHTVVSHSL
jgi:hypothetical protein